ncbi:hypothetical protein [Desulfovibrio sp. Fe33]|uniref:hypothetical protein n=1 Tax=Desulfovibrio sp. Fe33 TaxID=3020842 RepID=UPI00234C0B7D|nr:hypothetical protein [Desulfovibrio sp. Fe33]
MKRKSIDDTFRTLLGKIHAARPDWRPDRNWRDAVLREAILLRLPLAGELDRLAPRFTLAAAAVSGVSLLTAVWSLRDLSAQILSVMTSQALHFGASGLGL